MENLRPNEQRAQIAITLIWIVMGIEIMSFISSWFQYDLLQSIALGDDVSLETLKANDLREQIIGFLYLIALVISAVTFIRWFRRAYYNLQQRVNGLSCSEGWAAGSWFVPILSLFRPYMIMKELYAESNNLFSKKIPGYVDSLSVNSLGWWWGLWILNTVIGQVEFRFTLKADNLDELTTSTIISMVGALVGIPLAILAVKVVRTYAAVEPLMHTISETQDSFFDDLQTQG